MAAPTKFAQYRRGTTRYACDSMLKFHFNPKAVEALAKELRRASWGIAITAAAGGMKAPESAAWVIVGSAIIWALLQCAALR
jgi:hypothetical protein